MELLEENYKNSAERLDRPSSYLIKKAVRRHNFENIEKSLTLKTIYVGNLSHFTTEEQLYELFQKCGNIDRIIMGLDRNKLIPCGFCFIIYKQQQGSLNAMKFLKNTSLDGQTLEIDLDPGFREGRQFGRGIYGGQAGQENDYGDGGYNGGYNGGYRGGFRGRGDFRGRPYRGRGGGFRGGFGGGFRGRGDFRGRGRGDFRGRPYRGRGGGYSRRNDFPTSGPGPGPGPMGDDSGPMETAMDQDHQPAESAPEPVSEPAPEPAPESNGQ